MEGLLLIVAMIGAPIMLLGGLQIIVVRRFGDLALLFTSGLIAAAGIYLLIDEANAPPVMGNQAAWVGLGVVAIFAVVVVNIGFFIASLARMARMREQGKVSR